MCVHHNHRICLSIQGGGLVKAEKIFNHPLMQMPTTLGLYCPLMMMIHKRNCQISPTLLLPYARVPMDSK